MSALVVLHVCYISCLRGRGICKTGKLLEHVIEFYISSFLLKPILCLIIVHLKALKSAYPPCFHTPLSVWLFLVTPCRLRLSKAMVARSGGTYWTGSSRSSRIVRRWGRARCRSGCATSRSSATSLTTSKWVSDISSWDISNFITFLYHFKRSCWAASLNSLDQSKCFLFALTFGIFLTNHSHFPFAFIVAV